MAKVDMQGFRKNKAHKRDKDDDDRSEARAQEKAVAAPVLNSGSGQALFSGGRQVERKTIRLPLSQAEVTLKAMYIDPAQCLIHAKNRRNQSLLRLENPAVAKLKLSIEQEGQRDPVLARLINDNGEKHIEVIDGSRRRYVAELIQQSDPEFKLKVWVGSNISDADADYLTRAENDNRDDISAWETAQYLQRVERGNPSWSHEVIAAQEGLSRQSVSNYLALADIPLELVALLSSPSLLNVKTGIQLNRLLRNLSKAERSKRIAALQDKAPYADFSTLLKRFKLLEKPAPSALPTVNKKIQITRGDQVRADIGKNRSKAGQYKIDLYDLSEEEFLAVQGALARILG